MAGWEANKSGGNAGRATATTWEENDVCDSHSPKNTAREKRDLSDVCPAVKKKQGTFVNV